MHEMSILNALWEVVEPEFKKTGANQLTEIRILVGDYHQYVDEVLQVCFEALVLDYPFAKEAKLLITHEPAIARCKQCNKEWPFYEHFYRCPECFVSQSQIISGKSLSLLSIEVN